MRIGVWAGLLAVCLFAACGGNDGSTINVVVVSDFVGGAEVSNAKTELFARNDDGTRTRIDSVERPLVFSDALSRGVQIATLRHVSSTSHELSVTLLRRDGSIAGQRPVIFETTRDTTITVPITADCEDVTCPNAAGGPALSACLAGTCVDPRCTTETPEFCPANLYCRNDGDCTAGSGVCSTSQCEQGFCIDTPIEGRCAPTEYCARSEGCAPIDGPMMSGGDDPRCGTICRLPDEPCRYGYYRCERSGDVETVLCAPFVARPAHAPCGDGLECNASAECVPAMPDAGVDAGPDAALDAMLDGAPDATLDAARDATQDAPADAGVDARFDATPDASDAAPTPDMPIVIELPDASIDATLDEDDVDASAEQDAAAPPIDLSMDLSIDAPPDGPVLHACDDVVCGHGGTCESLDNANYHCNCTSGWYSAPMNSICYDVDECSGRTDTCAIDEHCQNTEGSYECAQFDALFAGSFRVCGVYGGRYIKCWGNVGGYANGPQPGANYVMSDVDVAKLAISQSAICALRVDGTIKCWGQNSQGQLGYGDTSTRWQPPTETVNLGDGGVAVDVSINDSHSCFVLADGTLKCWGDNSSGQLGYGDTTQRNEPAMNGVNLGLGRHATAVAAGYRHTCAVLDNGDVKCWGGAGYVLGYADYVQRNAPEATPINLGGAAATSIATYYQHACAIMADGSMRCWGDNQLGQCGSPTWINTPYTPDFGVGVTALSVAVGQAHTCGTFSDGTVRCFGANAAGQLGLGYANASSAATLAPAATVDLDDETPLQLVTTMQSSCVLLSGNRVKCWGQNDFGQLGYLDRSRVDAPSLVTPFDSGAFVTSVSMGYNAACALLLDHSLHCWGENGNGQLGYGDRFWRATPGPAVNVGAGRYAKVVRMYGSYACAILDDDTLKCWGVNDFGHLGYGDTTTRLEPALQVVDVGSGRHAVDVSMGGYGPCALLDNGAVKCWGANDFGQLGYGDTLERRAPGAEIDLGSGRYATAIDSGFAHTCAILDDDSVKCWGMNMSGQLGYGDMTNRSSPAATSVDLGVGEAAASLSLGSNSTCVLLQSGGAKCWGSGYTGYGDSNTRTSPPEHVIDFGSGVSLTSVGIGDYHGCALIGDDDVRCWGVGIFGQLGYGGYASYSNVPSPLSYGIDLHSSASVVQLETTYGQVCIVLDNGELRCWGDNDNAQLGNGYGLRWAPGADVINLSGRY